MNLNDFAKNFVVQLVSLDVCNENIQDHFCFRLKRHDIYETLFKLIMMDSYTFLKRKRKWKSGILSCMNVFSLMELQDPFENKKGKKENFHTPQVIASRSSSTLPLFALSVYMIITNV